MPAHLYQLKGKQLHDLDVGGLEDLATKRSPFWLDLERPTHEEMERVAQTLSLHPLAVEDALSPNQRPKIEEFPGHLLLVLHELHYKKKLQRSQIVLFLGNHFLVTVHKHPSQCIDEAVNRAAAHAAFAAGADMLAHAVVDALVDNYHPILDSIDEELDALHEQVFKKPNIALLNKSFRLKVALTGMHRVISHEREVLSTLSHGHNAYLSEDAAFYFRDVYDNLTHLNDAVESNRALLANVHDIYVSVNTNRLNQVMKVLTVIATIVLPLTLIVGYYGMNIHFPEYDIFGGAPGSGGYGSFYFIIAIMLLLTLSMIAYFNHKEWV